MVSRKTTWRELRAQTINTSDRQAAVEREKRLLELQRLRRPRVQWLRHDHYLPRRQRRLRNITGIVLVMRDGSTTGFRWGKVWNAPRGFFLQFRNENWLTRKLGAHR